MRVSHDSLAALLAAEVRTSGRTQREIADEVGISPKHLSRAIGGNNGMSLDVVDRILAACGRRLVMATAPHVEGD